jgi:K+-sensing histidine kinase KdpD
MGAMNIGDAWLMTLVMQMACLAAAFLVGGWMSRRLRSRKVEAGVLPAGGLAAPAPSAFPASAASPALQARDCGNGLLLSHEMKNYLCAIRGNAHLLRQKAKSPEQADILDRIEKALERMEGLAARDQSFPDVMATRRRERVDTVLAARSCCHNPLESSRAEFSFNASEGLPYIQGDPHRLEQVFTNLYGNALEAGADRVKTQFRRIGNELEISIEDNGQGCRPEIVPRLFDPCFSTKVESGTDGGPVRGLGLFIVRSIVENHGGRIRATSKNGRGYGETGLVVYMHFPVPVAQGDRAIAAQEDCPVSAREERDSPRTERLPVAAGA